MELVVFVHFIWYLFPHLAYNAEVDNVKFALTGVLSTHNCIPSASCSNQNSSQAPVLKKIKI